MDLTLRVEVVKSTAINIAHNVNIAVAELRRLFLVEDFCNSLTVRINLLND